MKESGTSSLVEGQCYLQEGLIKDMSIWMKVNPWQEVYSASEFETPNNHTNNHTSNHTHTNNRTDNRTTNHIALQEIDLLENLTELTVPSSPKLHTLHH
jgi:hypothetical protein